MVLDIGGPAIRITNPLYVLDLVVEQAFRSHTDGFCINFGNARLQGNGYWLQNCRRLYLAHRIFSILSCIIG